MKILVLGVNGFIGHSLAARILKDTDWEVFGMDLGDDKIRDHMGHPRFKFLEGDISINHEWIEYHVKKCDVVLPLVAIATPKKYIEAPLEVFSLDFEENLKIVRQAVKYRRRLIFPSTSEVYGMCPDEKFNEERSLLVLGPISKQRWIYSCAKQLVDRVIWAYGKEGLRFSIFRPFNWIGPRLDDISAAKEGSSRVVTQFLGNLLRGEPISLVDGGLQRRSFTYIDDGIEGLMRIIVNKDGCADGRIFNLGNPGNDCSIKDLAEMMVEILSTKKGFSDVKRTARINGVTSDKYYGNEYQDMKTRVPDISSAVEHLGWSPKVELRKALDLTIDFYTSRTQSGQARC